MRIALIAVSLLALAACGSADPMAGVRAAWDSGAWMAARAQLHELRASDSGNDYLYDLEDGIAALAVGEPGESEAALQRARDALDENTSSNAAEWFGAVMLDDRQLEYGGADYERVLVRAVLALANLVRDGRDAAAYALQVLEKQLQIIDGFEDPRGGKPKERYKLVAFGSYLRGIIAEEDPFRRGVAREAFQRVLEIEPDFAFGRTDLERVENGVHAPPGHGVLHVLAMVGRGPLRVEVEAPATAEILALAQIIWAWSRDRVTFPNIVAVPIPALAFYDNNPTEALIDIDGQPTVATAAVTDVERTAAREFEAMHDQFVARAVLRRAFKIVATEATKEIVNRKRTRRDRYGEYRQADPLVDLGVSILGLIWTAVERADLRCWNLLPASFQAVRIELPEGNYRIGVRAGVRGVPTSPPGEVGVRVRAGFNSYVVALLPSRAGGPPPLSSDPVAPTIGTESQENPR
jgi:hypothetical protein